MVCRVEDEVDEGLSRLFILRGLQHDHGVRPKVAAFLRNYELDVWILGGAIVAPAIPGHRHRRLARNEPRVEGGVVIGQQIWLRRNEQIFGLLQLGIISGVDRVAQGFQCR